MNKNVFDLLFFKCKFVIYQLLKEDIDLKNDHHTSIGRHENYLVYYLGLKHIP